MVPTVKKHSKMAKLKSFFTQKQLLIIAVNNVQRNRLCNFHQSTASISCEMLGAESIYRDRIWAVYLYSETVSL